MRVLLLLAVASWLTAGGQASIWPYHGSATGAVIDDYYYDEPKQYQVNVPVIGSLAANPIVVRGPVASSKAVIGPSTGPSLVQGPREGSATVVGPTQGSAAIVGPTQGSAAIVGPTQGSATIVGPTDGGAHIIGPTAGPATIIGPTAGGASVVGPSAGSIIVSPNGGGAQIIGPTAGGATIVGPTDGAATIVGPTAQAATIVGPTAQGATIVGPTDAGATLVGPKAGGATIVGPSAGHVHYESPVQQHYHVEPQHVHVIGNGIQDSYAHAEAHAEAHADAHSYVSSPVYHHVDYVQQPVYIKERPVYYQYNHPVAVKEIYDEQKHVVCAPALTGWSASAAARAVAQAASRYGPVHVSAVQGRPVVTISGPNCDDDNHIHREVTHQEYHTHGPSVIRGPSSQGSVIRGPSGEIIATNAHASAYAHQDVSVQRPAKWYPVRYSKC